MTAQVNVNGTWKNVTGISAKVSGAWKIVTDGWVSVNGVWKRFWVDRDYVVPAGAIIPWYSTGTVPTGWTHWGDDPTILKGWDGTATGINLTGGNSDLNLTTVASGSHPGSGYPFIFHTTQNSASYASSNGYASGEHAHTLAFSSTNPNLIRSALIVAQSDQSVFPAYGVVMGVPSFTGLTEFITDDTYLYLDSAGRTVGGEITPISASGAGISGSAGVHRHTNYGWYATYPTSGYYYRSSGDHTHVFTISNALWNLQRKYLKGFYAAQAFAPQIGMIVGWESNTPPDGWALCNGSNGTVDLRNYFVCIDSEATPGSTAGDNTFSCDYATDTVSHNHNNGGPATAATASTWHGSDVSHSHQGSCSVSQQFPFRTLAFIQAI